MRGVLQGVDGGKSYEAYVQSKVELEGKCRTVRSAISIMDQFVTILTLNSGVVGTPSQLVQLGQLQSAIANKRKELHDMVFGNSLNIIIYDNNYTLGNRNPTASACLSQNLQEK